MRMSNDAFNLLCNTLRLHISKEDTRFHKCIPAEIKLAAKLYYLSGARDYRTVALSRSRVVVENAFGCLKGRFQCIAKNLDTTLQHTVNIVTTCCILHIFCIITKQRFLHEWLQQTKIGLV